LKKQYIDVEATAREVYKKDIAAWRKDEEKKNTGFTLPPEAYEEEEKMQLDQETNKALPVPLGLDSYEKMRREQEIDKTLPLRNDEKRGVIDDYYSTESGSNFVADNKTTEREEESSINEQSRSILVEAAPKISTSFSEVLNEGLSWERRMDDLVGVIRVRAESQSHTPHLHGLQSYLATAAASSPYRGPTAGLPHRPHGLNLSFGEHFNNARGDCSLRGNTPNHPFEAFLSCTSEDVIAQQALFRQSLLGRQWLQFHGLESSSRTSWNGLSPSSLSETPNSLRLLFENHPANVGENWCSTFQRALRLREELNIPVRSRSELHSPYDPASRVSNLVPTSRLGLLMPELGRLTPPRTFNQSRIEYLLLQEPRQRIFSQSRDEQSLQRIAERLYWSSNYGQPQPPSI
jgi:hypothetical protein